GSVVVGVHFACLLQLGVLSFLDFFIQARAVGTERICKLEVERECCLPLGRA
ncbi:hypothetical protein JMJ77_0008065, partial [Colletotrichum scovillei]